MLIVVREKKEKKKHTNKGDKNIYIYKYVNIYIYRGYLPGKVPVWIGAVNLTNDKVWTFDQKNNNNTNRV